MESGDHGLLSVAEIKNGACLKSLTSRGNFKILITAVVLAFFSLGAFAQNGATGPLTWNISEGTLTISGSEAIPDSMHLYSPWNSYW